MEKGAFAKIMTAVSAFFLISAAAAPVLAAGFEYGNGSHANDGGVAIGHDASGNIVIGSSYDTTGGASGNIDIGSGSSNTPGVALGTGAYGNGVGYNAGGSFSWAGGNNAAFGSGAQAGNNTAIGAGATADGVAGSIVVGYNAYAKSGNEYTNNASNAFGANARAAAYRTSVFGYQSSAGAYASVAFGTNARATADNSVALGYGSVADRVDSISVGAAGNTRQIIHVADGVKDTDAATLGQLNQLGAMSAAIAGLTPMSYNSREHLQIMANTGSYGGRQAMALGVGYYDAGKSLLVTTGMASSGGKRMGRLGLAWRPGHARPYKAVLIVDGTDRQGTIGIQDLQLKEIQKKLKRQQAQAKRLQAVEDKQQAELDKLQEQVGKMLRAQAAGR